MDALLRLRHDSLVAEFTCDAVELRVVKTPPGSDFTRTISAFCNDTRALHFDRALSSVKECCASCAFQRPKLAGDEAIDPEQTAAD